MTAPVRLLANAVGAQLAGVTHAYGYYGQIGRPLPGQALVADGGTIPADPPPKAEGDPRVHPYFDYYPSAGGPGPDPDLAGCAVDITLPFSITAVAGDVEDLLALCERIEARIHRWTPTVPGLSVGRVEHPTGYQAGALLVDRDVKPVRLYVSVPYVVTATT